MLLRFESPLRPVMLLCLESPLTEHYMGRAQWEYWDHLFYHLPGAMHNLLKEPVLKGFCHTHTHIYI